MVLKCLDTACKKKSKTKCYQPWAQDYTELQTHIIFHALLEFVHIFFLKTSAQSSIGDSYTSMYLDVLYALALYTELNMYLSYSTAYM